VQVEEVEGDNLQDPLMVDQVDQEVEQQTVDQHL
jgi:hypothetical protein